MANGFRNFKFMAGRVRTLKYGRRTWVEEHAHKRARRVREGDTLLQARP